jgi:hypothetical protein
MALPPFTYIDYSDAPWLRWFVVYRNAQVALRTLQYEKVEEISAGFSSGLLDDADEKRLAGYASLTRFRPPCAANCPDCRVHSRSFVLTKWSVRKRCGGFPVNRVLNVIPCGSIRSDSMQCGSMQHGVILFFRGGWSRPPTCAAHAP